MCHEFCCGDGQCIDAIHVCDGTPQCDDGSDESREVCYPQCENNIQLYLNILNQIQVIEAT